MRQGKLNLVVQIENTGSKPQLFSVDIVLPRQSMLGFDAAALSKVSENKLGEIAPREKKVTTVPIWTTNQTKPGEYPVEINVYTHYLDYNKVMHYVKKSATIRVV